jgi:hypothetical protein
VGSRHLSGAATIRYDTNPDGAGDESSPHHQFHEWRQIFVSSQF